MKLKAMRLLLFSTAVVLLVACGGSAETETDQHPPISTATHTPVPTVVMHNLENKQTMVDRHDWEYKGLASG